MLAYLIVVIVIFMTIIIGLYIGNWIRFKRDQSSGKKKTNEKR